MCITLLSEKLHLLLRSLNELFVKVVWAQIYRAALLGI